MISSAFGYFQRKASEVLIDDHSMRLLASMYQTVVVNISDFDLQENGIALAKLTAANFCEIGARVIYITEAGQRFVKTVEGGKNLSTTHEHLAKVYMYTLIRAKYPKQADERGKKLVEYLKDILLPGSVDGVWLDTSDEGKAHMASGSWRTKTQGRYDLSFTVAVRNESSYQAKAQGNLVAEWLSGPDSPILSKFKWIDGKVVCSGAFIEGQFGGHSFLP